MNREHYFSGRITAIVLSDIKWPLNHLLSPTINGILHHLNHAKYLKELTYQENSVSSYTQGIAQYNAFVNDTKEKIGSLLARVVVWSSSWQCEQWWRKDSYAVFCDVEWFIEPELLMHPNTTMCPWEVELCLELAGCGAASWKSSTQGGDGTSWSINSVQGLSDIIVWLRDLMGASDVNPGENGTKESDITAVCCCSVFNSHKFRRLNEGAM